MTHSTYSIQEPPNGTVSSTRQDPELTQIAEEVESEETKASLM